MVNTTRNRFRREDYGDKFADITKTFTDGISPTCRNAVMSRNLTKTTSFRMWWFLEHPKNECLQQTPHFSVGWHIVFLIIMGGK